MLTKSLHTVTAAVAVARYANAGRIPSNATADYLARYALAILGYSDIDDADITLAKIRKACAALIEGQS
jgi:hypothetical protein